MAAPLWDQKASNWLRQHGIILLVGMHFLLLLYVASIAMEARDAAYSAGDPADNSDVISEIHGVTAAMEALQSDIGSVEREISSLQMEVSSLQDEVSSLRGAIYFR